MEAGFSIREYASRMRSVNMVKSWPFDDFATEQTVASFLPPIMVQKFSWWLDELPYSRSGKAIDVGNSKDKKKRVEVKGETSSKGVEDVDESDMDAEEGLGVVKVPKKRSIVEIFAAAPLSVERTTINHGEENDKELDGFSVNSKWGLEGKRNEMSKEKKKNKENMFSKLKNTEKARDNFKNKKRRGDNEMDVLVPNKEKRPKLKSRTQDNATRNLIPLYNKESEYGRCDHVSIRKRKSRPNGLDSDKKTMAHKSYKLMSENQQVLPVRGILKNHSKVSLVQNSEKNISQETIQLNHCGKQNENKQVTFSEKDDMIELARESLLSVERLKVPIINGSDIDAVAASFCEVDDKGIEEDLTLGETSGNEELSNGIQKEIDIGHSCKEPSTFHWCSTDTSNYLKQHKMDDFCSGSVRSHRNTLHNLKTNLFESGLREASQIPVHAYPSGLCGMPLECCCPTRNIKMTCDPSNSSCGSLVEDFWSSGARSDPSCSKDAYKKPPAPYLYNGGGIENVPQVSSQRKTETLFSPPCPYQIFPNLSTVEYMHSLCALRYGNRRGFVCEKSSINGLSESFLGLPLTLQGELIKLNSGVDSYFCQMKSSMTADPSPNLSTRSNIKPICLGNHSDHRNWGCRTSVDQLNLGSFQDNLRAKPLIVPSNLDFSECQSNGKGNCDLGLIKMCPFQPKSTSNQNNKLQKFPGNEKIISTVRLMGKEFIVGGGFGGLRDTLPRPSEMKFTPESMHSLPQFHGQTTMHKDNFPVQALCATVSPNVSFAVNRSEPVFPEALTSRCESKIFSLEQPTPVPVRQDSHPILISRAHELKNRQNWLNTFKSAIRFPFMHPDVDGEVLSSKTQSSGLNSSPLFVDVFEEGRLFRHSHSNCSFGGGHHSLAMSGSNLLD
ncbi:hypothetical protein F511_00287 [Dorcoceras hygrometricum]|nr:hypothetical protein F511_00287 [Dorcoceras hygrometricum]